MGYPRTVRPRSGNGLWSAGLGALAVFSLAFVAAACGGGGSHGSADAVAHLGTTTSTAASGPSAGPGPGGNPAKMGGDLMKYASCMRSHGVSDFPNPIISGNSVGLEINPTIAGSPDFKTAQAACQHLLPVRPTAQNFTTAQQADYLKAAQCMRSHGINGFPDPTFAGGGVRFNLPAGMDANSAPFEAAREICQKLIPNGLPYSASSEGQ